MPQTDDPQDLTASESPEERLEPKKPLTREERLRLFDEVTRWQRERELANPPCPEEPERGWKREDLYDRGRRD
jgi:hypothetical protein